MIGGFREEQRFGESIYLPGVTLETLFSIYRTGKSVKVRNATASITEVFLSCVSSTQFEGYQDFKHAVREHIKGELNPGEPLYSQKSTIDLGEASYSQLNKALLDFQRMDVDHFQITLIYNGNEVDVQVKTGALVLETFDVELTYDHVVSSILTDMDDYKAHPERKAEIFKLLRTPIIFELCRAVEEGMIPLSRLEAFLMFENIDFNVPDSTFRRISDVITHEDVRKVIDSHLAEIEEKKKSHPAVLKEFSVREDDFNTWRWSEALSGNQPVVFGILDKAKRTHSALWYFVRAKKQKNKVNYLL